MQLRPSFDPTDDAGLRILSAISAPAQIARSLGRSPEAIRRRAAILGVRLLQPTADRGGARWTRDEDDFVRLHPGLNPAVLAERLGRSDHAVTQRLRSLGLRAGRRRSPHHPAGTGNGLTPGERLLVT